MSEVMVNPSGSVPPPAPAKPVERRDRVIIRFAGDSGDGMQLTGDRFTSASAIFGNDVATLPDFPAEIRAPAGTLPGVSAFQVHFADHDILTPGDAPDVLIAMNPAALRANLKDLPRGAEIILDADEFTPRNLQRVGYSADPRADESLAAYTVRELPLTTLTRAAVADSGVGKKDAARAKNMFALGLVSWLYSRPLDTTRGYLEKKFARAPQILAANLAALNAGYAFGETTEDFSVRYEVAPAADFPAGRYRNISGNLALAYGLVAAGRGCHRPVFLGSYPITPASDVLHLLAGMKQFGVTTFQAEDEIAGIGAALGAAYGGAIGVTTTSGPGMALKSEMIGLAVALELPLVIVDVQRGGPSTGLPTKTEQSDLMQALFGRNGESPVIVIAAQSPSDCFDTAIEAVALATRTRTPVILLSDGYLANGTEPWRIPAVADLPTWDPGFATTEQWQDREFTPYSRDPVSLARPWALPGTPGLTHRIGGLEKADVTGAISYDPANHDTMVRLRQAKVDAVAATIPPLAVDDPDGARVLVLGWGSTYGPIKAAVQAVRAGGQSVARLHLRHLNPLPRDLADVLPRYDRVVLPEMNLGQLATIIRARYLVDVISVTQVRGLPFTSGELTGVLKDVIASVD
ncbi:MAG: 2-oxoacid:acceptor oxidoreductase subunit alpha [Actinomycetales bacterium]|nr:2-oxoacid:acceptor oxidoreductase subunit alpha [Actinomycetales bacterium]